jgi:SAM-dependent methyltransferase
MNKLDEQQKKFHSEHYSNILLEKSYDGFVNSDSIWYWMHTYCLEHIKEIFEKIPKSYFLTVGDGYCGREAGYIKKFGHVVHSSDIETCLIKIGYDKNIIDEYSEQDMNNLSFENDFFDYSLCKESLHHMSKPYQGLYEMFRVSKHGVILIEPNGDLDKDYSTRNFEPSGNYSYAFTTNELIKIGIAFGYEYFLTTYTNMFYGQHDIDNIIRDVNLEKNRLIEIDKISTNKPLLVVIYLKDKNVFDSISSDKFKKIKIK